MEAFEVSKTAVVLLNRMGEVIRANLAAERMLTGNPRVSGKRLVSANPHATAALDRALHRLLRNGDAAYLGPPIPLPRNRLLPVLAYPLRLSSMSSNVLADCQAIVVLIDPNGRRHLPEEALQVSFGLTDAEAKLASKIASGDSLGDVADELGIAKETSRNQLKSVFQKLGVHRQAELVAMLARLISDSSADYRQKD
jgi:DNA-binding CsgD family transcriptional regulator